MAMFPLELKRAWAQIEKHEQNSLFSLYKAKMLYKGILMKKHLEATTVAEKKLGQSDLARADPTAGAKSAIGGSPNCNTSEMR